MAIWWHIPVLRLAQLYADAEGWCTRYSCLHQLRRVFSDCCDIRVNCQCTWIEAEPKQQSLPCSPQEKSAALTTVTSVPRESLLWAGCFTAWDSASWWEHKDFYSWGKDAQMVCPEMWKHPGCMHLIQLSCCLAIIHGQEDVTGFTLRI